MNTEPNQQNISEEQQPLSTTLPVAEDATAAIPQQSAKKSKIEKILTIVLVSMIVLLVALWLVKCFVVCGISVSGTSMLPNYKDKQVVWVSKTAQPKRGDVVVLYKRYVSNKFLAEISIGGGNAGGKYEKLIKRIVAVEGDSIWVEKVGDEYVLVIKTAEGEILREDYYTVHGQDALFYDGNGDLTNVPYMNRLGLLAGRTEENPFVVEPNKFFYLGDNREISNDSRTAGVGAVHVDRIYGVVIDK